MRGCLGYEHGEAKGVARLAWGVSTAEWRKESGGGCLGFAHKEVKKASGRSGGKRKVRKKKKRKQREEKRKGKKKRTKKEKEKRTKEKKRRMFLVIIINIINALCFNCNITLSCSIFSILQLLHLSYIQYWIVILHYYEGNILWIYGKGSIPSNLAPKLSSWLKVWITSMVGDLSQEILHKNAWTFDGTRGNHIVLWGKREALGVELRVKKEEETQK